MGSMVDKTTLARFDDLTDDDPADPLSRRQLAQQALWFLVCHEWCASVRHGYAGMVYEGILGVFFFEIEPLRNADPEVWVIVGDLPPAYIACDDCPNAAAALDGYCGAMSEWVQAVRQKKPVDDLIPVNAPPTEEYADLLERRLRFIYEEILPEYEDDLKA